MNFIFYRYSIVASQQTMKGSLPFQKTKLGHDGKGPKAYIVKQTHIGYILFGVAFLLLIIGALVVDYKFERFKFSLNQQKLYKSTAHQRVNKLSAENKLMKISAVLQSHLRAEKREETNLQIMQHRITEIEAGGRVTIGNAIKDKEVNKQVLAIYDHIIEDAKSVVNKHLASTHRMAKASQATMKHIQQNIIHELQEEIQEDTRDEEERQRQHGMGHGAPAPAGAPGGLGIDLNELDEEDKKRWKEAETSLNHMLEHLEEKIQALGGFTMATAQVKEWERVLEQTNNGGLAYEEAERKMKQLMNAPSHGPMKSIINEDLPIVENFEMLLEEIKFLPQKKKMLAELAAWKRGEKTVHEVLLYIEQKMGSGDLDPDWMVGAATVEGMDAAA